MIFEKSSTRTRISFEAGMAQFGGTALFCHRAIPNWAAANRWKTAPKSSPAWWIASCCAPIKHETVTTFAKHSRVPVINGLTDLKHPCQLLADMQTYFEFRGDIAGKTVAWIGDGNNMCHSYINAARQFGFKLNIACPVDYRPLQSIVDPAGDRVAFFNTPEQAAHQADLVVTDVWASMGQEEEQKKREFVFKDFQVNAATMAAAKADALFMHCLPAHRGEEVTAEVIDGPQSVVFPEAENRLHAQKALLEFLICR